jgi:PIN domain nuclease of toxin-antitoxin system
VSNSGPVDDFVSRRISEGYKVWPISREHAASVATLPWHHRDPFDRLLAAQALSERCAMVTVDRMFRKYGVDVVW